MSELKTLLQQFLFPPFSAASLPRITDWDTLCKMWKNAEGTLQTELIEAQMQKALPSILSGISDWPTLVSMRCNARFESIPEMMIEGRMEFILPDLLADMSHWDPLVEILEHISPDSAMEQVVVRRMEQVLGDVLPGINEWKTLIKMWDDAPPNTTPEKLIEQRMAEMIEAVSIKDTPRWFMDHLADPGSTPLYLCTYISFKARELSVQL